MGAWTGSRQPACRLGADLRQSGKWQGHERIEGGRTFLRRAIYMPALAAARFNRDLKVKFDQLIAAGKPPRSLAATMRKLIVLANALLRDGRPGLKSDLKHHGYSVANHHRPFHGR